MASRWRGTTEAGGIRLSSRRRRQRQSGTNIPASPYDSGFFDLYTGAPPADPNNAPGGDLLATGSIPSRAFYGSLDDGTRAKHGIWQTTAETSGIAGCLLLRSSNGLDRDWVRIVLPADPSNVVVIDYLDVQAGDTVTVTGLTLVLARPATIIETASAADVFSSQLDAASSQIESANASSVSTGELSGVSSVAEISTASEIQTTQLVAVSSIAEVSSAAATQDATVNSSGVLFQDSFSSGDFSHTQNGISWIGNVYVDAPTVSIAKTGSKAARFREGDSVSGGLGDAELRFDGLASLHEVFLEYYVYFPDGTEGVGPKAKCIGSSNDKFFRLWGGGDGGYSYGRGNMSHPYASKVGASMYGIGSGPYVDGKVSGEFSYSSPTDPSGQYAMGQIYGQGSVADMVAGTPPVYFNTLIDANRGRWMRVRIRTKEATIANNDGVLQMWLDSTLVLDRQSLANGNIYGGGQLGYTTGYIFGAANNGWPAGQYVYVADVTISTGGFIG